MRLGAQRQERDYQSWPTDDAFGAQVSDGFANDVWRPVIELLTRQWKRGYKSQNKKSDIIYTTDQAAKITFMFDIVAQRLLTAFGRIDGKNTALRDKSRQAGHPTAGPFYHKGHAFVHQLHGGAVPPAARVSKN